MSMSKNEIIDQLTAGKLTPADAKRLLAEADAASAKRKLRLQVSAKGALSVYGLQSRFPVTLYAEQWETLLDMEAAIRAFIKDNASTLSRKDRGDEAAA